MFCFALLLFLFITIYYLNYQYLTYFLFKRHFQLIIKYINKNYNLLRKIRVYFNFFIARKYINNFDKMFISMLENIERC